MKIYNLENETYITSHLLNDLSALKNLEVNHDHFQDDFLKEVIKNYNSLKSKELSFSTNTALVEHLIIESKSNGVELDFEKLSKIKQSFTDFENIDYSIDLLKNDYHKNVVAKTLMSNLISKSSSGGIVKADEIVEDLDKLKKLLISNDTNVFLNPEELSERYYRTLIDREDPRKKKSIGFKVLDKSVTRPGAPKEITIFAALRAVGKSTFRQIIENNLINKNVPVVSFSLEMSEESTMDRMISSKTNIPMIDLNKESKKQLMDSRLKRTLKEFKTKKNFLFTDRSDFSFDKIDAALYKAKEIFRKNGTFDKIGEEYMIITIDVLNMVSDFGSQEPTDILKAMDKLHNLVKKHNVHCIGIVQINETKLRGGKIWKSPEDLNSYRPNLEDIYGGAGYAQRARVVGILHRPKALKERMFPEMKEIWDAEPDILEFHCVKQNDGILFLEKFIFDGEKMRISPLIDEI
jgi:replicative DNA helicase